MTSIILVNDETTQARQKQLFEGRIVTRVREEVNAGRDVVLEIMNPHVNAILASEPDKEAARVKIEALFIEPIKAYRDWIETQCKRIMAEEYQNALQNQGQAQADNVTNIIRSEIKKELQTRGNR